MHQPLRIGFVGAEGHFIVALEELAHDPRVRFVAAASAWQGEGLGPVTGHPAFKGEVLGSAEDLCASGMCDIVVVSTRHDRIFPSALVAVRHGLHVICEKPYAMRLADLESLEAAVKDQGVEFFPLFGMRTEPAFRAARDVIASGSVGEPRLINTRKSYKWGTRPAWFADRTTFAGIIPWVGIHAIDLVQSLVKEEPLSIHAITGPPAHPDYPDCESSAIIAMRYADGVVASASLDYCRPAGASTHGDDWLRVAGTRGVVEANGSANWCRLIADRGEVEEVPLPQAEALTPQFISALLGSGLPPITTEDGFRSVRVSLRAQDCL